MPQQGYWEPRLEALDSTWEGVALQLAQATAARTHCMNALVLAGLPVFEPR